MKMRLQGNERAASGLTGGGAALLLALAGFAPAPAGANTEATVMGLVAIGGICAATGACTAADTSPATRPVPAPRPRARIKTRRTHPRHYATPPRERPLSDDAALDPRETRLVQRGLAAQGYYNGPIDGVIGPATRQAIRQYQASVGDPVTGILTGEEANALAAMAPRFDGLPPDSPQLFAADVMRDTNSHELRIIQRDLNALGYDAGPADGRMGSRTRRAIAAYKADEGLPGDPIPTQRLLARLEGRDYPATSGRHSTTEGAGAAAGSGKPAGATAGGDTVAAQDEALRFRILGIGTGMSQADVASTASERLGGDVFIAQSGAGQFGDSGPLTKAELITSVNWPDPGAQQIAAFFDAENAAAGAVAVFRMVVVPDGVTEADFRRETLPSLVAAYGTEGRVGETLTWIGDRAARQAAESDPTKLAACGAIRLRDVPLDTPAASVGWERGKAPQPDPASLDSVTASCGDVFTVRFGDGMISFALWDSDRLTTAAPATSGKLPKIEY